VLLDGGVTAGVGGDGEVGSGMVLGGSSWWVVKRGDLEGR
jgi:hypothetical protein